MSEQEKPNFDSFEEMMEWIEKNEGEKKPKKSSSGSTKKSSEKVAPETTGEETSMVWSVVHFYTRPGQTTQATLQDAKDERKFRNDNVIVRYHTHPYMEPCVNKCREV